MMTKKNKYPRVKSAPVVVPAEQPRRVASVSADPWNLWIDDERDPVQFLQVRVVEYEGYTFDSMSFPEFSPYIEKGFKAEDFVWCRSAADAILVVGRRGPPKFMALDHDLGSHDVFRFLSWLFENHPETPPEWYAHSANYTGRDNINAYMRSWRKVHGPQEE